jgi:hypothetical protein
MPDDVACAPTLQRHSQIMVIRLHDRTRPQLHDTPLGTTPPNMVSDQTQSRIRDEEAMASTLFLHWPRPLLCAVVVATSVLLPSNHPT